MQVDCETDTTTYNEKPVHIQTDQQSGMQLNNRQVAAVVQTRQKMARNLLTENKNQTCGTQYISN